MTLLAVATVSALALWWASTGVLLYLDRLPAPTYRHSMVGGTVVLLASLAALWWVRDATSVGAAFVGFVAALGAWSWQELSFYTGYVTGPRRHACPPGCSGVRHFGHAVQASLYHELAIVATAATIAWISAGAANRLGLWIFLALWVMHESARVNVLLGVRNIHEEFLPDHLSYLRSFCRVRRMNPLMPVSLLGSGVAVALVAGRALEAATAFDTAAWSLLAATLAIGLLEHVFLALPIPVDRLWAWVSPPSASPDPPEPLPARAGPAA
ncbi:MAG: putative photosynthetic complex assembly protein PuhE [Gemmatimonadota bacterium]